MWLGVDQEQTSRDKCLQEIALHDQNANHSLHNCQHGLGNMYEHENLHYDTKPYTYFIFVNDLEFGIDLGLILCSLAYKKWGQRETCSKYTCRPYVREENLIRHNNGNWSQPQWTTTVVGSQTSNYKLVCMCPNRSYNIFVNIRHQGWHSIIKIRAFVHVGLENTMWPWDALT